MIDCPICGKSYQVLTSHVKSHGYKTKESFLKEYPNTPLVSDEFKKGASVRAKNGWETYKETHSEEDLLDRVKRHLRLLVPSLTH